MRHVNTAAIKSFFNPLLESAAVQAATMVLKPGQSSADRVVNEHPRAEQWVFVASGTGRAKVAGRSVRLKTGSLVFIEKGEPHQIANTGAEPLVTVNFYAPPAYTGDGEVKRSVTGRKR